MPTASSLIDALTTPRVAGRAVRGLAFLAAGAAFLAIVALLLMRLGRSAPSAYWTAGVGAATALGVAAIALAWDELRRPVRFGFGPRPRNRAIERAPLRWHPTIPGVIDVYDETHALAPMQATTSPIGLFVGAAREATTGSMRVKLAIEDSPLHVGAPARVGFRAVWDRGTLRGTSPTVRMRCLREDSSGFGGVATRVETLADLAPRRTEIAGDGANVTLSLAFDLPSDLPGSDLLAARPVYWVLDVEMSIPLTFRFRRRYFLPVEGAAPESDAQRRALPGRAVSS